MDEPEPQHAYDFFASGTLPCYAGNPNNTNRWIKEDVPLLGELGEIGKPLGAEVDEPLVDPVIDELAEPIVEVEEQMVALVMDMEEDLACSFMLCDLDFEPLSLSLSSLPSCDLLFLTNMLILLHYLESFKSELAEVFVFKS
ncbi:hypothetical protein Tco_0530802 [Tanacetum coccineum]